MGGATAIYAIAEGLAADGLLLFDPMLNTSDALSQGGYVGYGLPPILFKPMATACPLLLESAPRSDDALPVGAKLALPVHIVQNKDDPITRSLWSEQLAQQNPHAELVLPPTLRQSTPAWQIRDVGAHTRPYHCHPEWTMSEVERLLEGFKLRHAASFAGQAFDATFVL